MATYSQKKTSSRSEPDYKRIRFTDNIMPYCPGCGHGKHTRIIAEVVEKKGVYNPHHCYCTGRWFGIGNNYFEIDIEEAARKSSAWANGSNNV